MTDAQQPEAANLAKAQAKQIRGSTLLLAGTFLSSAVEFVTQIVLVRYLSKDGYGAWSYGLAIVALFAGVAQFEMRNAASRFIPVFLERRERGKLLGTVILALAVAAGLGALIAGGIAVAVGILGFRPTDDPQALHVLLLLVALIPIQAVDSVFTGLFAAFGASRTIFLRQSVLAPVLRLALVATLVVLGADVGFLAIGYVLVTLVGILLYVTALRRVLREHDVPSILTPRRWQVPVREIITFAAPLLTTTLVWMLMESSDAVLLGWFHDPAAVAEFRVVLPLARMNGLVSSIFSVLFLPLAARAYERGDLAGVRDLYWRTALWMTVLSFPVLLVTACFAPGVTIGLYGQAYASSAPILALLAIGYFFNTALGFNGLTVKVHGRLRYTVIVDIVAAVVNVAVNLVLIPRYGPIGAAVGTASTLVLHNVLKHTALARLTQVPWFERRYGVTYALLATIALAVIAIQTVLPHALWVAVIVSGIGGILGVLVSRRHLDLRILFPELDRLPLPGWFVRLLGPAAAP
jgi:O-antigen/teichoic acid export membrane protein